MFREAERILMMVSLETGVPMDMMTRRGRTKNVAKAKNIARWRLRKETDLSLREIDLCTGGSGRNHRIEKPEHTF